MIVDAHEDIAWNMATFGRNYLTTVMQIRELERATDAPKQNGNALLGRDAWLKGEVAVVFATLFAAPAHKKVGAWETQVYATPAEAHDLAMKQLDTYSRLFEATSLFAPIPSVGALEGVLETWGEGRPAEERRIGLVLLMEGAEAIEEPGQVADWFERGIRIVGPAWEATRYAGGTHEPGPLTEDGKKLLRAMARVGMILDLTHLAEEAYYQAFDYFEGTMIASHANPRRFLPTSRGLSDDMIRLLVDRGGVVGIVPYNLFLDPNWKKSDPKDRVSIHTVITAIDHVCQLAGSAKHVALGSDFDGGFGREHVPAEIDTVADLAQIRDLLWQRHYSEEQIADIMSDNWLRILRRALPA